MSHRLLLPICIAAVLPGLASAEVELSFYGGYQTAPHSEVSIFGDDVVPDTDFTAGWDGGSFQAPPYYGIRATWWPNDTYGFGIDVNHVKIYADDETLAETGYDRFEYSDGLNVVTLNAYRNFGPSFAGLEPYVGAGVGLTIPHIELTDGTSRTAEYQIGGPAVALIAGASYPISERWDVFGEYKGTYSVNSNELKTGGTVETNIVTNALNVGVSFNF